MLLGLRNDCLSYNEAARWTELALVSRPVQAVVTSSTGCPNELVKQVNER